MNLKAVLLRQTFCQSSYTEAFSWHKVHIWTFKSKYVNRCLLSKSIIKLDFTWVRKILFPSLCICHLEIIFHFRRQPYGLWLERVSEKVEYPTRVRWARAFQMKAMPPSSENVESNETDHYFSHGFQAFLPQVSDTHWIHSLLYGSAWIWHLGKCFFQEFSGISYLFGWFLLWAQMEQNKWYTYGRFLPNPYVLSCGHYS